jgi:hypothetical protein
MKNESGVEVGQRVTLAHRGGAPIKILTVERILRSPKVFVLSDGSRWEWGGWRPYNMRSHAYYTGPSIRATRPEDGQLIKREKAIDTVKGATREQLQELPLDLLLEVAKAIRGVPANKAG